MFYRVSCISLFIGLMLRLANTLTDSLQLRAIAKQS